MFAQHTFIEEAHKPVMESVIRQKNVVTEKLLAKLYQITVESLEKKGQLLPQAGVTWSFMENKEGAQSASATEEKTGIYVQLTAEKNSQNRMLTVGQKWSMQAKNLQSIVTKLW